MSDSTIEIITGKERRRRWSSGEKLRIVAETDEPGAHIGDVAAWHDVYPSLLSTWRRQVREGLLGTRGAANFVPVRVMASSQNASAPLGSPVVSDESGESGIEIILPDGTRLDIRHATQLSLLRPVIAALRA
jgi:transposase